VPQPAPAQPRPQLQAHIQSQLPPQTLPPQSPLPQSLPPQQPRVQDQRPADPVSDYAKRPAPQGLDVHGRQTTTYKPIDDDQLDIPAFLRRQAN